MAQDAQPTLPERIELLHRELSAAGIPHAFGGALALAYYAEPRATNDIDVNLFIPPDEHATAVGALNLLGANISKADLSRLLDDGQCRAHWGTTPIDLFFANHPFHQAMQTAARGVPFGRGTIPILSAEHLIVCKALYDRPRDWLDVEQVLQQGPPLDRKEVKRWVDVFVDAADPRGARLAKLLELAR
jgi:hypothetical protein